MIVKTTWIIVNLNEFVMKSMRSNILRNTIICFAKKFQNLKNLNSLTKKFKKIYYKKLLQISPEDIFKM